ncbi:MAG: ABC transporter substrate-binding protein [Xanthobacteraceae bacterium]|uniref:ABC transporter substrate-binding protein n=1 Tax=Pseudolabrys sp. TaxID=1960880 RepID=UPI003D0D1674
MSAWIRIAAVSLGIVSYTVAAAPASAQDAKPLTKVVFSLDFIPLGRHAPWYAALAEGYFKDEGLDVSIIPSQGTAQVIQAVESGTANIGFVDVPSLVLARSNGSKIKMVAVNYQKAPYAIFSLSTGANVTQPKQLEGLTLGSGAGSSTPKIIQGFMAQKGLDPAKLTISNVAPPARASMLLAGQVPAIEFFVMSKPGLSGGAKAKNAELRTLLLADHGLQLYSNGIAATEDYLAKNGDVVKRFVRAALKGWKFALANPEKAAAEQIKYVPSLKPDVIVAELGVVGDLAVTDDTKKNGFGWFDPAKMKANVDFVVKYIGVTGKAPAPADLYATGFLPSPAIKP